MFSKNFLATLLQILGAAAITLGISLIFLPAGVIVGGIFSLLFGLAIERLK